MTGLRVERGFSGAPVWDEILAGVVGMAVAAETQRQEGKVAFIIPTKILSQAWSILEQSMDAEGRPPLEQEIDSNPVPFSPDKSVPEVKIPNQKGIKNWQPEANTTEKDTIKCYHKAISRAFLFATPIKIMKAPIRVSAG